MPPLGFDDFSDSPTIFLPPQRHSLYAISQSAHSFRYHSFQPIMATKPSPKSNQSPATASILIAANSSKKRVREEASPGDDAMDIRLAPSRTPGISPTDIAGEKMARINPMTGFAATAETQTGGWFENQLEQKLRSKIEEKSVQTTDSEDALPKRKLRRRDTMSYSNVATASRPSETQDPVIDKYTHLLGIGWAKLGDDPHVLAAARGWSTYIEKHYPLSNAKIVLKSKSLDAYLVNSAEGWYLFKEDLSQGRLVAAGWEETLVNLQSKPVRYTWAQPLLAAKTPGTSSSSDNGIDESAAKAPEGGMDVD